MLSYAVACCDKAWPKLFESQDKAARAKTGHGNGKRNIQQVTSNAYTYRHIFFDLYVFFYLFWSFQPHRLYTGTTGIYIYRYQGMEGIRKLRKPIRFNRLFPCREACQYKKQHFHHQKMVNRRKSDGIWQNLTIESSVVKVAGRIWRHLCLDLWKLSQEVFTLGVNLKIQKTSTKCGF